MNEIRYRIAKPSDAKEIADVHWHVRDRYKEGLFLSMGKGFLKAYYKVILNDPWEVVVCAVNENGKILGFISNSLDAKERYRNIKNHKLRLGFAAIKSVFFHPSVIKGIFLRYKSLNSNNSDVRFCNTEGVRVGYWCWLKDDDSLKSVELNRVSGKILRSLGVEVIYFEVDKFNKAVYKFNIKVNKAEPIEEITLPDGRVRVLMRKKLV